MTTDTSEKGLESLIMQHMTGTDGLVFAADGITAETPDAIAAQKAAGSGWLAYRLALRGHSVIAVDLLDDALDGLGAKKHYGSRFAAILPWYFSAQIAMTTSRWSRRFSPSSSQKLTCISRTGWIACWPLPRSRPFW